MDHIRYLDLAFQIAQETPKVAKAKMAAVIVYKNRIVSVGTNSAKTHPFMAKFGVNPYHQHHHAETCAIAKALKLISSKQLRACTLYVCRAKIFQNDYIWGLSKPCSSCVNVLEIFPTRFCFYSKDNLGEFAQLY